MLGSVCVDIDLFLYAGSVLNMTQSTTAFYSEALSMLKEKILDSTLAQDSVQIFRTPLNLSAIDTGRQLMERGQKVDFIQAMTMSRQRKSTDPRDRIYGILGIAAEFDVTNGGVFKPDYNLTVEEVYASATASVIQARGDLACLTLVCDTTLKNFKNLPSWSPDYSAEVAPMRDLNDVARTWRLGFSWSDAQVPKVVGASLQVDGFMFDVVVDVATLIEDKENKRTKHGVGAVFGLAAQLKGQDPSDTATR
jgi:hypothetical protein